MVVDVLLVATTALLVVATIVSLWCEARQRFTLGGLATMALALAVLVYGHKPVVAGAIYFIGPALFALGAVLDEKAARRQAERRQQSRLHAARARVKAR